MPRSNKEHCKAVCHHVRLHDLVESVIIFFGWRDGIKNFFPVIISLVKCK